MLQPKKKKATPKKKTGVSDKRKASAKKAILKAKEHIRKDKTLTGRKDNYSTSKKGESPWTKEQNPIRYSRAGVTHSVTRSKALLKNLKSKVAKRGAAKSKKSKTK